jgi:alkylhydroperoxidase/carboxymuconolactone decarboxylase family protein YurZ
MTPAEQRITLTIVRSETLALLEGVPEGDDLDPITTTLIELGVRAAVTTLDPDAVSVLAGRALDAGATPEQIHEALVVVSGLGVHTLMEGTRRVAALARERGLRPEVLGGPLDERRLRLREAHQGSDPYWAGFEREVPGFLDDLLRMSPEAYTAFFDYCAVPWRTCALRARTKELLSLACDATPAHRYLPGLRLHVSNALALGAGRRAVLGALDLGAAVGPHPGVPAAPRNGPISHGTPAGSTRDHRTEHQP